MDFILPNIQNHWIENDYEIYTGFDNPWKNLMKKRRLYENGGLFEHIIHENIPKMIGILKDKKTISSYIIIFKGSSHIHEDEYSRRVPYNINVLGTIGIWTKPEFRNKGLANKICKIMSDEVKKNVANLEKSVLLYSSQTHPVEKVFKNFTACDIYNVYYSN